jgi:hypothetical protein
LIGEQPLELAPIELKRNKKKIVLSMRDQSNFSNSQAPKLGSTVNINTTIDVSRAREDRVAVIPFSIKNDDFNLTAQLKIFNQQNKVYLEFESYIDQIDVSKINENIPKALANTEGALWLNKVISDGILTDVMLTTRFNMSGNLEKPNTKFSANLINANLNINSNWPSINDLNAKVTFSNNYLKIDSNLLCTVSLIPPRFSHFRECESLMGLIPQLLFSKSNLPKSLNEYFLISILGSFNNTSPLSIFF